jgi:RNA polymerase sigma factor (sigma-70 family)
MSALIPAARRLACLVAHPEADSDAELLRRFIATRDSAAFAGLVNRHGPMVLSVCRRAAVDDHAAEDAYQATFLALSRKAAAVRTPGALPAWLFATARRLAVRARLRRIKCATVPPTDGPARGPEPLDRLSARELLAVLDIELARLPARHRSAVLLCIVDGLPVATAARRLGASPGAVRGWLQRGRDRLRLRLVRRGLAPSAILALAATCGVAPAATLTATAAGFARLPERAPATVAALVTGSRARGVMTGSVMVVGLAGIGLALGAAPPEQPPAAKTPAAPVADPRPTDTHAGIRYAGVVLDKHGKPLAGATVHICGLRPGYIEFKPRETTGADGRFDFTVRIDEFDLSTRPEAKPGAQLFIGATAPGHGSLAAAAVRPDERERLSLRMPAEEIASVRVIDTEGRPTPNVTVGITFWAGKLDSNGKPVAFDNEEPSTNWLPNVAPTVDAESKVTDKDGRLTIRGLSANWLYHLYVQGPGIVSTRSELVARKQKDEGTEGTGLYTALGRNPRVVRHGSDCTIVVTPSRVVTGIVREKGTGKPIAGVTVGRPFVADPSPPLWTKTDKDGRFRLDGMALSKHELRVDPSADQPYLETRFQVDTAADLRITPVDCVVEIARQRLVVGRVVNRATGKGVIANVEYRALAGNPALKDAPELDKPQWNSSHLYARTGPDGRFAIRALPGPAVLLVRSESVYRPASPPDPKVVPRVVDDADLLDLRPYAAVAGEYHAVVPVEIAKEGPDASAEIALDAGGSIPLEVRSPDRKARETWVLGREPAEFDHSREYDPMGERVGGLSPGESRTVFALTRDNAFGGHVVLNGREDGPVVVTLKPTGTITGRLVDKNGKPLAGQSFQLFYDDGPGRNGVYLNGGFAQRYFSEAEAKRATRTGQQFGGRLKGFTMSERSDAQGRFKIAGLIPEVPFDLWVVRIESAKDTKMGGSIVGNERATRVTVEPGQTKDLSDLKVTK